MTEVQGNNVGVIDFQQHLLLRMQMHQLILLKNFLLAHDLESVNFTLTSEFDELDPAKGAITQSG